MRQHYVKGLKLSQSNGATTSVNGYQLGIVGEGSISASQITFPVNTENTVSKTSLGLNTATKNIEGKEVSNNPTTGDYFDINVKVGSFKSGNNIFGTEQESGFVDGAARSH